MKEVIAKNNFMHNGSVMHAGDILNLEDGDARFLTAIGRVSIGEQRDMEAVEDVPAVKKTKQKKLRQAPGANA